MSKILYKSDRGFDIVNDLKHLEWIESLSNEEFDRLMDFWQAESGEKIFPSDRNYSPKSGFIDIEEK